MLVKNPTASASRVLRFGVTARHGKSCLLGASLEIRAHASLDSSAGAVVRAPKEQATETCNFDPAKTSAWIKECSKLREAYPPQSQSRLPDRVPDLSHYLSGFCKLLCITSHIQASYAVLSYCWGTSKPFRTTTSDLDAFQAGIPLHHMPRTY